MFLRMNEDNQGPWPGHSKMVNDGETPSPARVTPSPWEAILCSPVPSAGPAELLVGMDLAEEPSEV